MNKKYLCIFVCTLVIISALPIAEAVYWWPKFRHDVENTGYSESSAPNQGHTEWTYEVDDSILCAPSVQDGKIYFGSDDYCIYCIDSDSSLIWSYYTGVYSSVDSSPAVAYGMVYIGADNGYFYCFDADPSDGEDEGIVDPGGG